MNGELTDRDLELIAVALESAAQSCQSGASLRQPRAKLDPLAREYLIALQHVEQLQAWLAQQDRDSTTNERNER